MTAILGIGSVTIGLLHDGIFVDESDRRLSITIEKSLLDGHLFTGAAYSLYTDHRPHHLQWFWRGKIVGTEYLWYPNGGLMAVRPYLAGLPQGQWKMWYEDGKVKSLRVYVNGVIDGEMWAWHPNGRVADFNVYNHGHELTHKSWISDGVPYYNYVYQDGVKVGMLGGDFCKKLAAIRKN
jgi:antitoxin component YwqK of YwqJK toxin-antitoxin module